MISRVIVFLVTVILKCYETDIQYLGNVTLPLVATSRNDKKLAMPSIVLFLCKNTALDNINQDLLKLNTFVNMCSTV